MPRSLRDVVAALDRLAPLSLADDWDNVGLLVDAPERRAVQRCLLTVDLTEAVLDEAIDGQHELIVAYHPPWFAPLKRLRCEQPGERVLLRAIRAGIAIHSPHTALDAAPGGVNDWLAEGLGPATVTSLRPVPRDAATFRLEARLPAAAREALARELEAHGASPTRSADGGLLLDFDGELPRLLVGELPDELRAQCSIVRREPSLARHIGAGRAVDLAQPTALGALLQRIRRHLGLERLRVATAPRHAEGAPIERVLVCAGAGGSVLAARAADLFWTGEMRHHDLLAALARGTSVVLCDHSNTERGYLPVLRERLAAELAGEVTIHLSRRDAEPLEIA